MGWYEKGSLHFLNAILVDAFQILGAVDKYSWNQVTHTFEDVPVGLKEIYAYSTEESFKEVCLI